METVESMILNFVESVLLKEEKRDGNCKWMAILKEIQNGSVKICAVEKSPKSEIYAISNLFF